jgi:hypothetical protein
MARPADRALAADCRLRARCRCRRWDGAVVYRYGTNKQIFVASRCLGGSVLAVRLGWLRSGYERDTTRLAGSCAVDGGPWRWEELEAGAGGAGASTAVDEDQTRLRPRPRRSAQRVETQNRAVGVSTLKPSAPALRRRAVRHCTGDGGRLAVADEQRAQHVHLLQLYLGRSGRHDTHAAEGRDARRRTMVVMMKPATAAAAAQLPQLRQ